MRLNRIFKTAAFKLALSYASLFAVSSAVLFGIVYWSIQEFESQLIRKSIASEASSLELMAKSGGNIALVKLIAERARFPGHQLFQYALFDGSGTLLVGKLPTYPWHMGWQHIEVRGPTFPDGDELGGLYAYGKALGDGYQLFVAQDDESLEELSETVASTFALGSAITLVLAVLGGLTVSSIFVRRIEHINRTSQNIMAGAINERMPVRGTNDEFDRLSHNLNLMLDRIELLVGNLKRVSSDIAHDLRTPLSHLRQGLEQAKVKAHTVPELQATVDQSIASTDSILRLFGALLRISEIESGEQRSNFCSLDLSKLATKIHETFAPVAEDEGCTLKAKVEPSIVLLGDPALLTQMIANLCENAMRHTPSGSQIVLCLRTSASEIVCSVSDNGPGVPDAEREAIFRPFFRLDQSRSTPGSGLGLALVKAIAELHGGRVAVLDANPGATFEVRLPHSIEKRIEPAPQATPGRAKHGWLPQAWSAKP